MSYLPLLFICVLSVSLQVGYVLLFDTITENLARVTFFSQVLFTVLWVVGDAQRRGESLCYEFDFLVYITYPFSLFWWTWRTRRWLGLLSLTLVPPVVASIVLLLLHPELLLDL